MSERWKTPESRRVTGRRCTWTHGTPLDFIGFHKKRQTLGCIFTDGTKYEYRGYNARTRIRMFNNPYNAGCVFNHEIRWEPAVEYRKIDIQEFLEWTWIATGRKSNPGN